MQDRLDRIKEGLDRWGLDAALIWYSRDVLYYTGTAQPAYLLILPGDCRLFVKSGWERAEGEVFIDPDQLEKGFGLKDVFNFMRDHGLGERAAVGTELDVLPAAQLDQWRRFAPGWTFSDISPAVLRQRQIKGPEEVEAIRKACEVVHAGHIRTLEVLQEGVSEWELSAAVEDAQRLAGHEGTFFMRHPDFFMGRGLLASGPNLLKSTGVAFSLTGVGPSASIPAGASGRVIRRGDLVLIDIPVHKAGYHVDQARTYLVGRADPQLSSRQRALEDLFLFAAEFIRPGRTWGECFLGVQRRAEKLKVKEWLQAMQQGRGLHYIGHGVGLELNEPPLIAARNQAPVLPGTVAAIEMHLLEKDRTALKMEDMLLVGEEKNEYLSPTPRRLFEV